MVVQVSDTTMMSNELMLVTSSFHFFSADGFVVPPRHDVTSSPLTSSRFTPLGGVRPDDMVGRG